MDMPKPVDVSALAFLANAKKVMDKVEGTKPVIQKQSYQEDIYESAPPRAYKQPIYSESDEREPVYENYTPQEEKSFQLKPYSPEQVMSSRLPANIKEAMLKTPITPLTGIPSKVTVSENEEFIKRLGANLPKKQNLEQHQAPKMPINEITHFQSAGVSKSEIQQMVNEAVANYFKGDYEKRITEAAIKKTIGVLIKEGKLNVKKKI